MSMGITTNVSQEIIYNRAVVAELESLIKT